MVFDLAAALPRLLPRAIAWAEAQEAETLGAGTAVSPDGGVALARAVGVERPDMIRVSLVDHIPLPNDPDLRHAAIESGLIGPGTLGITFGYAIYIPSDQDEAGLLWHECRHVHQYEQAGSIAALLPVYLNQIVEFGYDARSRCAQPWPGCSLTDRHICRNRVVRPGRFEQS